MPQQTIAIIGSEKKAGSLFMMALVQHPAHRLLLLTEAEHGPDESFHAFPLRKQEGKPEQILCLKEGCWEADIIVLDVSFALIKTIADKIRDVSTQKIVFVISTQEQNAPARVKAAWAWQDLLPNSKVVAALNDLNRMETLLAGNDDEALNTIAGLSLKTGFHPRVLGKLPEPMISQSDKTKEK